MKTLLLVAVGILAATLTASAHLYVIPSPTHGQTFAYGSENHSQWLMVGRDHHLALSSEYTNDPFVDRFNPRQYDEFTFHFPNVRLGADGHTFYYHAPNGQVVPVATRSNGFLGVNVVKLLDTTILIVHKPHGYLSLLLVVDQDRVGTSTASL